MVEPLRLHTLERKAKRIHLSDSWRDAIGLARRRDLAEILNEIRRYISSDLDLPERYYRHNRTTTPDRLLEETGIMHLHLGSPDTAELLYLVQFSSAVVFLEISNHRHLDLEPPGSVLRQLHDSKLKEWRAKEDAEIDKLRVSIKASLEGSKRNGQR